MQRVRDACDSLKRLVQAWNEKYEKHKNDFCEDIRNYQHRMNAKDYRFKNISKSRTKKSAMYEESQKYQSQTQILLQSLREKFSVVQAESNRKESFWNDESPKEVSFKDGTPVPKFSETDFGYRGEKATPEMADRTPS